MYVKLSIGAFVVAVLLGLVVVGQGILALQSSSEPETIALGNLIERGPDGNAHVIVKDFALGSNFVYESRAGSTDRWTKVWVPIKPYTGPPPQGERRPSFKNVKALIYSSKIQDEASLLARLNKPQVQGLVTNRTSSLDAKTRELLQKTYPDTDFATCLIIDEGRGPFGWGLLILLGTGCVVSLGAAAGFFLMSRPRRRNKKRRKHQGSEQEADEPSEFAEPEKPLVELQPVASFVHVPCACGAKLKIPKEKAGKRLACPRCKNTFQVPLVGENGQRD